MPVPSVQLSTRAPSCLCPWLPHVLWALLLLVLGVSWDCVLWCLLLLVLGVALDCVFVVAGAWCRVGLCVAWAGPEGASATAAGEKKKKKKKGKKKGGGGGGGGEGSGADGASVSDTYDGSGTDVYAIDD
jgi:hypothetical protein